VSKPTTREYSTDEVRALVRIHMSAYMLNDAVKELGKRQELTETRTELTAIAAGLLSTFEELVKNSGDEDRQAFTRRKAAALRCNVTYAPKPLENHILLHEKELNMLVGNMLNYCEYECPCVTVDEEGRTVDKAAVKGCEIRKMFRRLGLEEKGSKIECPYTSIIW